MENKYQEILNKLSFFNENGSYDVGKSEEVRKKNIESRKKDIATIQELIDKVNKLQQENEELKAKIIESNEENAILNCSLQEIIENQSKMLKALKPYLDVKELDRKDGKGKEYRCYVKNGYCENYFNISKEEYELLKEWLDND